MSKLDRVISENEGYQCCQKHDISVAVTAYNMNEKNWTHDQIVGYLDGISKYLADELFILEKEKEDLERLAQTVRLEKDSHIPIETEENDDDT